MIGNLSKAKSVKGDPFTFEDFTPEQLDELRGNILTVLDPDSKVEKTEVIPMEVGGLHRTSGLPEERDDAIRSADYLEVTPGKTVFFTSSLPIEDNGTVRVCFYDENHNFIETVHYELETDFTIESEWRYLKLYRSDTNNAMVEMALATRGVQAEFKKIYFADHGYVIYGDEIDDETMHKLVIEALGKDDNEYNIVELKAPKHSPEEASLALMNKGDGIFQIVDFSSLVHDVDNPTVEIVCQTRGDHKLPEFSVRFNDGKGAGRIKKFAVKPDCIPMTLTSEGIQVRRNNTYNNRATEEELVTVNLANLYDRICELEKRQPRKITINLPASAWVTDGVDEYSQVVSIENAPSNCQVDLQPSKEQLAIFRDKDITFWVETENEVITVCCLGQKPTKDYVMQATIMGVTVDE